MIDKITQYKVQQAKELFLLETDVAMFLVHLVCDTIALNEKYVDVCLFEDSCTVHWISGTQCPQIGTKSNLQAI